MKPLDSQNLSLGFFAVYEERAESDVEGHEKNARGGKIMRIGRARAHGNAVRLAGAGKVLFTHARCTPPLSRGMTVFGFLRPVCVWGLALRVYPTQGSASLHLGLDPARFGADGVG